jgi:transcriptional pleiotropic regulator of transition state genes
MTKTSVIVRKVDDMGRFTLPKQVCRTLNIQGYDSLEVSVDGDRIILRKCEPACVFCGNANEVRQFKEKSVCQPCLSFLSSQAS